MDEIDKKSPIPLYFQMARLFMNKITNNEWEINTMIPTELKLCEDYQISRGTVRKAIDNLVQEGFLNRKQGVGTFVCKPCNVLPVSNFYCVELNRKSQRIKLRRKILSKRVITPNNRIKKLMRINDKKKLFRIKGMLLIDRTPIALETLYLLKDFFPNLKSADLATMAPYEIFMLKYNLKMSEVRESFSLKELDKKDSEIFSLPESSYALLVDRFSWSNDTIFEYRQSIIRTDKCHYTVNLL
ncbi:MAG: GntR family transcriptional regulator [Candidatus Atribacteria bacterium]|nr:GntR family transcriptional regulator [Candidatus Atribacteria bacterium]